jgi:hypothetical protein
MLKKIATKKFHPKPPIGIFGELYLLGGWFVIQNKQSGS